MPNLLGLLFGLAMFSSSYAGLLEQNHAVTRPDGSAIELQISRPASVSRVPVLLVIDGSLCIPSRLSDWIEPIRAGAADGVTTPYAMLIVEKPQPTVPVMQADGSYHIGPEFACSPAFKQLYSIDQRVLDHLRALQFLRRHADWWDGRLVISGFSDGARIASRVAAFTPQTQRLLLGGLGGGRSMAQEFEDFHICPAESTADREACITELRAQFDAMRRNPSSEDTWNGDANTWRAWASRLDAVESNILRDLNIPVLLFHGSEDGSVPVSSARLLAEQMAEPGGPPFEYREIFGMSHGLGGGLSAAKTSALQAELLDWLLTPLSYPTQTSTSKMTEREALVGPRSSTDSRRPSVLGLAIFGMLVLIWFALIKMLCHRLERCHAEKYAAMGRPSLVLRNSIASTSALLWFLLKRQHRALNDRFLSRLSDGMLMFQCVILLSAGLVVLLMR